MTLKELESQLLELTDVEKDYVVQFLTRDKRVSHGIEKTPGICGGSACIVGTRITGWGLVESRRAEYSDADLLISFPTLNATQLANAWAYAESFPDEIEAEIQANAGIMLSE